MANKVIFLCPHCGSADIGKDATAVWSVQDQRWELAGEQDNECCGACGEDGNDMSIAVELPSGVEWTDRDDEAAVADGWSVFMSGRGPEIQRFDIESVIDPETERPVFESDEAALERVGLLAVQGLEFARRALALHHGV